MHKIRIMFLYVLYGPTTMFIVLLQGLYETQRAFIILLLYVLYGMETTFMMLL